jgi:hypothetical protein
LKQIYLIFIPLFLVCARVSGQEEGGIVLSGKVTDELGKVLIGVHVIDRSTIIGTTTNRSGKYSIMANREDTVLFSFIGFKTREFIVPSNFKEDFCKLDMQMEMDTLLLKSTVVYPFPSDADALMKDLLTVEIVDTVRKVDMHLEMVPIEIEIDMGNYRTGEMHLLSFGGAQQIFDAVSHKAKMKKKYQQVLERERIDKLAEVRLTDSLIMRATGLVEKEAVKALREYCNLQPEFIVNSTDYELYVAIMDCYVSFSSQ